MFIQTNEEKYASFCESTKTWHISPRTRTSTWRTTEPHLMRPLSLALSSFSLKLDRKLNNLRYPAPSHEQLKLNNLPNPNFLMKLELVARGKIVCLSLRIAICSLFNAAIVIKANNYCTALSCQVTQLTPWPLKFMCTVSYCVFISECACYWACHHLSQQKICFIFENLPVCADTEVFQKGRFTVSSLPPIAQES